MKHAINTPKPPLCKYPKCDKSRMKLHKDSNMYSDYCSDKHMHFDFANRDSAEDRGKYIKDYKCETK